MVRKTYESPNCVIANWVLIHERKQRTINFTPITEWEGSRTGRGSIFTTTDEWMQNAIESSRLFGSDIFLFKTEVIEEKKTPVVEEKSEEAVSDIHVDNNGVFVSVKDVDTPNGAREYLRDHYNLEMRKLPNIKSIINAAKELGVTFECFNK